MKNQSTNFIARLNLEPIKKIARAASPEPWSWSGKTLYDDFPFPREYVSGLIQFHWDHEKDELSSKVLLRSIVKDSVPMIEISSHNDLIFIADSPTFVPLLIEEVERLRRLLEGCLRALQGGTFWRCACGYPRLLRGDGIVEGCIACGAPE